MSKPQDQSVRKQETKWIRALYALPLLAALYGTQKTLGAVNDQVIPGLIATVEKGADVFPLGNGQTFPVIKHFFGLPLLDKGMRIFVAAFTPALGKFVDAYSEVQGKLFLVDLIPFQTIWMIESYRRGNASSPVSLLHTLFGLLYQVKGVGFVAPAYYFLHYVFSPIAPTGGDRFVQVGPAKIFIPTVILTYLIPSIAMSRAKSLESMQWINGVVWQLFPLYAAILRRVFSLFIKDTTTTDIVSNPQADLPYLRRAYIFAGAIPALAYISARFTSPVPLFDAIFRNVMEPSAPVGILDGMSKFFRWDQICCFSATTIWTLLNFWDLKRTNTISASWLKILGVYAGTTVVAGPGAAMAAMAYWREECLASKAKAPIAEKSK